MNKEKVKTTNKGLLRNMSQFGTYGFLSMMMMAQVAGMQGRSEKNTLKNKLNRSIELTKKGAVL